MGAPAWAILVLVGYPLVQIPLLLYLARWFELDGEAPVATPTRAYWTAGAERPAHAAGWRPGLCTRCGADNDPAFTYCGRCVTPL